MSLTNSPASAVVGSLNVFLCSAWVNLIKSIHIYKFEHEREEDMVGGQRTQRKANNICL